VDRRATLLCKIIKQNIFKEVKMREIKNARRRFAKLFNKYNTVKYPIEFLRIKHPESIEKRLLEYIIEHGELPYGDTRFLGCWNNIDCKDCKIYDICQKTDSFNIPKEKFDKIYKITMNEINRRNRYDRT
jgi:hypothetical protein